MDLREYLEENRLTYREFAERLGIHIQSLKNIAYGQAKPSLKLALRIEEFTEGAVTPKNLIESNSPHEVQRKRKSLRKRSVAKTKNR